MEKTQEMLETGSYGSLISKLSIPTIITMLVMVIYNIADLFIFSFRLSDRQETRISLSSGSLNILKVISDYASGIPPFVVNLVLMVVSTFFIGMDYVNIVNFVRRILPDKWVIVTRKIKNYGTKMISVYVKSYAFLMLVAFLGAAIMKWVILK